LDAKELIRETVEKGSSGVLGNRAWREVEELGEFLNDDCGVAVRKLIIDDFEILLRPRDTCDWEEAKVRHESIGLEDLSNAGGVMGAKKVEKIVVQGAKFFQVSIVLRERFLPSGDGVIQLLFSSISEWESIIVEMRVCELEIGFVDALIFSSATW